MPCSGIALQDAIRDRSDTVFLLSAVKMDPYCVLQSGKETVKTKRAHGMISVIQAQLSLLGSACCKA